MRGADCTERESCFLVLAVAGPALLFHTPSLFSRVGCAAMECHGDHGDRLPRRYTSTVGQEHDGEAREGVSRRAPARSGRSRRHRGACLGDEVRHGVPIDVFPRQAAESNALLFSLDQPLAGYMVKSMRLIPRNMVGQACERVRLRRLPREACYDQERGQSKVDKDMATLNEEQGEVLPRRKDTTSNGWSLACEASLPVATSTWRSLR